MIQVVGTVLYSNEQVELLETQLQRLTEEARYVQLRQQYVELNIAYWHAVAIGDNAELERISASAKP